MLETPLEDWPLTRAVLNEAGEIKRKHDEAIAKYNAHLTANRTVAGIGKTLNRLMAALRSAQSG